MFVSHILGFCHNYVAYCCLSFLTKWAIPENIHTIPRMAFRISEGEGGVHDYGILRAWRNSTGGISGVESVE